MPVDPTQYDISTMRASSSNDSNVACEIFRLEYVDVGSANEEMRKLRNKDR